VILLRRVLLCVAKARGGVVPKQPLDAACVVCTRLLALGIGRRPHVAEAEGCAATVIARVVLVSCPVRLTVLRICGGGEERRVRGFIVHTEGVGNRDEEPVGRFRPSPEAGDPQREEPGGGRGVALASDGSGAFIVVLRYFRMEIVSAGVRDSKACSPRASYRLEADPVMDAADGASPRGRAAETTSKLSKLTDRSHATVDCL